MVATTTAFSNLLANLTSNYPQLTFRPGEEFRWSPDTDTVWYQQGSDDVVTLLHEAAHGLLGHDHYDSDIELLHLERDAWTQAIALGREWDIKITEKHAEEALDTYRDWLHARSLCPSCQQNGIQQGDDLYICVVCGQKWHVNDARHYGLKRRKVTN